MEARKKRVDKQGTQYYGPGSRPVDQVALRKRKLERESWASSGKRDEKGSLFQCDLCDSYFTQAGSLQKHARQKHKKEQIELGARDVHLYDTSLKCSHCGIFFSSHSKLEAHLATLLGAEEKQRLKRETAKQEMNVKVEPLIHIKEEPDEVVTSEPTVTVKNEPSGIKLEEHSCSDCDFRTFVKLEFMDHVMYDCGTGEQSQSSSQPQEMGEGWSFKSGAFFCLKCKFTTRDKRSIFSHARNVH